MLVEDVCGDFEQALELMADSQDGSLERWGTDGRRAAIARETAKVWRDGPGAAKNVANLRHRGPKTRPRVSEVGGVSATRAAVQIFCGPSFFGRLLSSAAKYMSMYGARRGQTDGVASHDCVGRTFEVGTN